MIDIKTKKGNVEMSMSGDINELIADIGVIIRSVWQEFDGEDREYLEHTLKKMLEDEAVFISDEELIDFAMDNISEIVERLNELDKDSRKHIMDAMPDKLLAEVISEVMKDVD